MTNRRVQRILPLLVLAGMAMPVQATITVEQAEPSDCPEFACLEVAGQPVIVVADEPTSAAMSLYQTCPGALRQALGGGDFEDGSAVIQGCGDAAMTFLMTEHSSGAFMLTPHEGLLAPASSGSDSPSCIDLVWQHLFLVPGVSLPSVLTFVESVVIVRSSCPELSLVFWLLEGNPDARLQLLGFSFIAA